MTGVGRKLENCNIVINCQFFRFGTKMGRMSIKNKENWSLWNTIQQKTLFKVIEKHILLHPAIRCCCVCFFLAISRDCGFFYWKVISFFEAQEPVFFWIPILNGVFMLFIITNSAITSNTSFREWPQPHLSKVLSPLASFFSSIGGIAVGLPASTPTVLVPF